MDFHQICWQKWGISESKFTDCYQICLERWGLYLPEILLSANLLADLLTFTLIPVVDFLILTPHLPSRLTDSPNLLADLLIVSKSAGRFAEFTKSADRNVGVCISAGRLTDLHKIYWPIYWLSPNLLGDLLTFTKSASRNEGKHWLSPNLPADLLTVTKSTGRFADIHIKTSGRNEGMFLLANILIVTKSASRFAECY